MYTEGVGKQGDGFKFNLDMSKELGIGAGLVTTGLAIGAALIAIEATVGLAAAGGAIAAAFSALMAATGPFLASAITTIGVFLSAVNPIVPLVIVAVVVVIVAIALIALAVKNSRTSYMELVSKQNRTEEENDELAGIFRAWVEEGEIDTLRDLLEGKGREPFNRELFFIESGVEGSVMSHLIEQGHRYEFLYLFEDQKIERESITYFEITNTLVFSEWKNAFDDKSREFLYQLAKYNFPLVKDIVQLADNGQDSLKKSFENVVMEAESYEALNMKVKEYHLLQEDSGPFSTESSEESSS